MDLRNLQKSKDESASKAILTPIPLPLGANEEPLTTSPEVKRQEEYNQSMTQVPIDKEPEVTDTETPVHIPSLTERIVERGRSYEESTKYRYKNLPEVIRRKPNKWSTLCNLDLPIGEIVIGWNQRIGQDTVYIENQSGSAGDLYIAASREDLQGSTIRGKKITAGNYISIEVEGGGYLYAPSGATIDLIITWYENE